MRVAITGGRNFTDYKLMCSVLDKHNITHLILGDAKGADALGLVYATKHNIDYSKYTAKWELYGDVAGIVRNGDMLTRGKPDLVIAFPGGKGTRNMVYQAKCRGTPVHEVV